ncbi:hypothetical protein Mapa_003806 [Marchantia paleacea]|nr:hypothetical protein Mapa_003806 [Marchantia paleacea]
MFRENLLVHRKGIYFGVGNSVNSSEPCAIITVSMHFHSYTTLSSCRESEPKP